MKTHNISKQLACRLLFLVVATLSLMPAMAQESQQHAIYNYRNDGDFNAWLDIDVEKITYSCTDLDGVEHDDIVVQEVWTPDSVYRIPINAIDSIGFRAPETIIRNDVFIIREEHVPYTISVDELKIVFDSSTPSSMLPSEGQVVVSETFASPYDDGFVGRVKSVSQTGQSVEIVCEDASLYDIYDRLVAVGKLVSDETASAKDQLYSPRRKLLGFDDIDKSGIKTFEIGKQTLKNSNFEWISAEYTPEITCEYVLYIQKDEPIHIKLLLSGKHDVALNVDYKVLDKISWENKDEIWIADVPLPYFYGFKPIFKIGLFYKVGGKAHVKGKIPVTISHSLGIEYHGRNIDLSNVNIIKSFDMDFKEPTLDFKLDGYLTGGLCADLGVKFLHQKIASIEAIMKMGPKITTSFDLSANDIINDPNIYSVFKNTKLSLDFDMGFEAEYTLLKKKAQITPGKGWPGVKNVNQFSQGEWETGFFQWSWPLFECYILPEFSHSLSSYNGQKAVFKTSASRELFLPVKLGAQIENNGEVETVVHDQSYRLENYDTWAKDYESTFSLDKEKTYSCRPLVELLGYQIPASPAISVDTKTSAISVAKGKTAEVEVPDRNGSYSVKSSNTKVATCKVSGSKIVVSGVSLGNAIITITDSKKNVTTFLEVTVNDGTQKKLIKVEPKEIAFGEVAVGSSKSATFTVSNVGTASLTVTVASGLDEGDDCVLPGSGQQFTLAAGQSKTFTVTYSPTKVNSGFNAIIRILSDAENDTEIVTVLGRSYKTTDDPVGTETFTVNGVSFTMVGVDGGTFWMGSADDDGDAYSDERPRHEVTLGSFAIGQTEVTQELWEAVMGSNPSSFKGGSLPVERVSWNDCQEFLTKLNALTGRSFRLPTEAEWEYAARGGSLSQGYKYSGSDDVGAVAWYSSNSGSTTHAVGTKAPNELGLYDMSGNVWEWCQDFFSEDYYNNSPDTNPCNTASASGRVDRGGGWFSDAGRCRVAFRFLSTPDSRSGDLGLRLAH